MDTHLFVRFPYASPVDLSGAEWLVLDPQVPAGQRTATQMLVILHEQDGGDFIASTGRSLSAAGPDRVFVSLNQFQLAGWSKDADGRLDLTRVGEIRVGWGGYFGREGEQVQFTLSPPQIGARRP